MTQRMGCSCKDESQCVIDDASGDLNASVDAGGANRACGDGTCCLGFPSFKRSSKKYYNIYETVGRRGV